MKKLASFICMLALLVTLCACGAGTTEGAGTTSNPTTAPVETTSPYPEPDKIIALTDELL